MITLTVLVRGYPSDTGGCNTPTRFYCRLNANISIQVARRPIIFIARSLVTMSIDICDALVLTFEG